MYNMTKWDTFYGNLLWTEFHLREGVKKNVFFGICPKLWVGGGPKSQTL